MIDEEVKKIFDEASARCEQILTEHADQLRDIAEYLLIHETMEAEDFNYYFDHGEFMPIAPQDLRRARNDTTIERPAKKISMTDGYAEAEAKPAETPAEAESRPTSEENTPASESPAEEKKDE